MPLRSFTSLSTHRVLTSPAQLRVLRPAQTLTPASFPSGPSALTTFRSRLATPNQAVFRRTLIAAPKAPGEPLLERRADRALPDIRTSRRTFLLSLPIFLLTIIASALAIFNYQKTSSSVVTSTLYALRTNSLARSYLGDEIQFASKFPWIWGKLDQFHGNIDIRYKVAGTKGKGEMRFKSTRKSRMGLFETEKWELVMEDGTRVELLTDEGSAEPFPVERQADK
ncbi:cytochrome oxidase complex assembly protein 1-domain-containing protein [Kalaharituber pfeilii]|nr:cytochrome oxidase complex assembly protein 1-domain-containing protein [Kalaharituber pfeilii]